MTGIAIFGIIITVLLFILVLLCVKVSKSIVTMLKMGIITILPLLYVIIGIAAFSTNNIIILLLFIFIAAGAGRINIINIINIIIKKSDINKIIILLLIYINIIMPWLFILIIKIKINKINTAAVRITIFNINNIIILLF